MTPSRKSPPPVPAPVPPVDALVIPDAPAAGSSGPAAKPTRDVHRLMTVLPMDTYNKLLEMAEAHNCLPASIIHMAILSFYRSDAFMETYRKTRGEP